MKKKLLFAALMMLLCLTACSYDPEKLEAENQQEKDEKREHIMEQMEIKLKLKYAFGYTSDENPFDVYDLSKGSNKAWFQYGVYPVKAVSHMLKDESEEFVVRIETDGKKFGPMEDNYYGILYGDKPKEELADLVSAYPLENVDISYEPCEDILRAEDDLKKHLVIFGEYHVSDPVEVDTLCELIDMLNSAGYIHRIAIHNDITKNSSIGSHNISSIEVRDFFDGE